MFPVFSSCFNGLNLRRQTLVKNEICAIQYNQKSKIINHLPLNYYEFSIFVARDVAQSGSVHVWGACGRRFESCHPDFLHS